MVHFTCWGYVHLDDDADNISNPGRIQDLSEGRQPVGQIFPKTAWKCRILNRERGRPKFVYVDPPLVIDCYDLETKVIQAVVFWSVWVQPITILTELRQMKCTFLCISKLVQ